MEVASSAPEGTSKPATFEETSALLEALLSPTRSPTPATSAKTPPAQAAPKEATFEQTQATLAALLGGRTEPKTAPVASSTFAALLQPSDSLACQRACLERGLSRCFCNPGGAPRATQGSQSDAERLRALWDLQASKSPGLLTSASQPCGPAATSGAATSGEELIYGTMKASSMWAGPATVAAAKRRGQIAAAMEPEAVTRAKEVAKQARDIKKGIGPALVDQWREVSKPRKQGPGKAMPAGCKVDFPDLFNLWLQRRGLEDALEYTGEEQGWRVYKYVRPPLVHSDETWERAFHGTWWYSVWLVLHTGVFLESDDRSLGHDFWEPGVYCSPNMDTGLWYSRPQVMFNDGVFHRVLFELRVDPKQRKVNRKKGGTQWVFPSGAVQLYAVWVRPNAPPKNGEERVNGWEPQLEAVPPGTTSYPEVVRNPRRILQDPWPVMHDPCPFDSGDNSAPPWLSADVGRYNLKQPAVSATKSWDSWDNQAPSKNWAKQLAGGTRSSPSWQPTIAGVSQQLLSMMMARSGPHVPGLVSGGMQSLLAGCGSMDESAAKRQRLDTTSAFLNFSNHMNGGAAGTLL
jgi:hypothetical protein